MSHYLLPEEKCAIMFSGGRSSGYMLYHILDAYDGTLPDNVIVTFQNTGKEKVETLDFIHECESRWGINIAWLEYRYDPEAEGNIESPRNTFVVVDYSSASRNGEPFEQLVQRKKLLPNPVMRICTAEMKIETCRRYLRREMGWTKWHTVLGLRGDEPNRLKGTRVPNVELGRIYPMAFADVTVDDVNRFWDGMDFDLGISSHKGNCDLCFLKGRTKLIQLIREDPSLADWWIEQEKNVWSARDSESGKQTAQFTKYWKYSDLKYIAENQLELPFAMEDEEVTDCFCTD